MCSMKFSIETESLKSQISTEVEQSLSHDAGVNGHRNENEVSACSRFGGEVKIAALVREYVLS